MLDDIERLRENPRLIELLAHYAALGTPDRSIWQKRVSEMEGIDSKELSRLHGELIAFDWIEQNPSRASASPGIALSGIYRITSHGVRDLCQLQGVESAERPEEPHRQKSAFPSRKRKQKTAESETAECASAAAAISEAAA
jgi:hypothetical protein